jgi:heme-binding NEAT domain protein
MQIAHSLRDILTSAARSTSGNSSWFNVADVKQGFLLVNVSAVSGTNPKLTIKLQTSPDQTDIYTLNQLDDITETGKYLLEHGYLGKYFRLNYTIEGTNPSFTFEAELDTQIQF